MIKGLVVHDREDVASQVIDIVRSAVSESAVELASDGVGARSKLSNVIYDLLVIDLTLPHSKGGVPDYRVADELLRELFTLGTLNIPGDVIGLTRDMDALNSVHTSLGPHVMIAIHESEDGIWKKYLEDKIAYASRAAITRQISVNRHFLYDAMIVTALDSEFEPYRSKFDFSPIRHFAGASEFPFNDKKNIMRRGVAYSIGKSGQARAASATQSLLNCFRPRIAFMSGFCGGMKEKAKIGESIFFESSYDWDYGKWTHENNAGGNVPRSVFFSRPMPISIEGTVVHRVARKLVRSDFSQEPQLLREIRQKSFGDFDTFEVHLGPAASGSAVVANDSVIEHIRGLNEAIRAVDMESYGFYCSCSQTNVARPEFICVKSVADFCNGEKGDKYHDVCSTISSLAIVDLLRKWWDFDGDA